MTRSKLFKNNRSQALRLPKAVAFPEEVQEVEIIKMGRSRLVSPAGKGWDEWWENGPRLSKDFDIGPELPLQKRKPFR